MKHYFGQWTHEQGAIVGVIHDESDRAYRLPPRCDLYNHSPTGFAWGYGGSGPAQLALAILADYLEDDAKALRCIRPSSGRSSPACPQAANGS
jgi:hypothetical protein